MKKKIFLLLIVCAFHQISCAINIDTLKTIHQSDILLLVKEQKSESYIKIFLSYLKDFLPSLIAIVGLWKTYPLIKNKLISNHISNTLEEIQKSNTKILINSQEIKDKYSPNTYDISILKKEDIETILKDVNRLFYDAQTASRELKTLIFFLKKTLEEINNEFDPKVKTIREDVYSLIDFSLSYVAYYATKIVPIPESTRLTKKSIIKEELLKYTKISNTQYYADFDIGIDFSDNSEICTIYFSYNINKRDTLILKSIYNTLHSSTPIAIQLHNYKIYTPLELKPKEKDPIANTCLRLISFSRRKNFHNSLTNHKNIIELYYISEGLSFDKRSTENIKSYFIKKCYDSYLTKSQFIFDDNFSFKKEPYQIIKISVEEKILHNSYLQNKLPFNLKIIPNDHKV